MTIALQKSINKLSFINNLLSNLIIFITGLFPVFIISIYKFIYKDYFIQNSNYSLVILIIYSLALLITILFWLYYRIGLYLINKNLFRLKYKAYKVFYLYKILNKAIYFNSNLEFAFKTENQLFKTFTFKRIMYTFFIYVLIWFFIIPGLRSLTSILEIQQKDWVPLMIIGTGICIFVYVYNNIYIRIRQYSTFWDTASAETDKYELLKKYNNLNFQAIENIPMKSWYRAIFVWINILAILFLIGTIIATSYIIKTNPRAIAIFSNMQNWTPRPVKYSAWDIISIIISCLYSLFLIGVSVIIDYKYWKSFMQKIFKYKDAKFIRNPFKRDVYTFWMNMKIKFPDLDNKSYNQYLKTLGLQENIESICKDLLNLLFIVILILYNPFTDIVDASLYKPTYLIYIIFIIGGIYTFSFNFMSSLWLVYARKELIRLNNTDIYFS
ncbi:hypothetical protein [Mycoplasma hafezii]|uniref:hypothetical protein n=1 Tax=Mycoplasma hafezii TaxID=525886 RepID=UPI003CE79C60